MVRRFLGILVLALLTFSAAPGTLVSESMAGESRVPLPSPAKAFKGEQCVEPAAVMRREHMVYLQHQRDETVRDGIRGKKYSLKECVACHATASPKIADGSVRTLQPFCAECHAYAAVTIDCFACHTDKPDNSKSSAVLDDDALMAMIENHLKSPGNTELKQ